MPAHRKPLARRVATAQLVTIGQRWRCKKTKVIYVVRQVHRKDRKVELQMADATAGSRPFGVWFTDLRRRYELLD